MLIHSRYSYEDTPITSLDCLSWKKFNKSIKWRKNSNIDKQCDERSEKIYPMILRFVQIPAIREILAWIKLP